MKKRYLSLVLSGMLFPSLINAQSVSQIYDYDSTDLTQLYHMPFDESRMLVVAGFESIASKSTLFEYDFQNNQLNEMSFAGVDTI